MLYFWNLARGIIEAQPQVKCISGEKKTLFSTRLRLLLYQCASLGLFKDWHSLK